MHTRSIDTKSPERVELSDVTKQEIREIVRDAVREELTRVGHSEIKSISVLMEDNSVRHQLAQLEEKKKNADELVLIAYSIAFRIQAWLMTPPQFGGPALVKGERRRNFKGASLSLQQLGYNLDPHGSFVTMHGRFDIELKDDSGTLTINGYNDFHRNHVEMKVSGPRPRDITIELHSLPQ